MRLNRILLAGCAVTLLLGFAGASFANGYNDGFIAAESGDYKTAFQKWEPLARKGNALAQFNLALLYHSGAGGVEVNEQKAVSWYLKAADNGYYYAQEYMAVGYQEGWFGLPKDKKQAAYWLKRLQESQY
jgi:TPR repeat protein